MADDYWTRQDNNGNLTQENEMWLISIIRMFEVFIRDPDVINLLPRIYNIIGDTGDTGKSSWSFTILTLTSSEQ